MSSYAGYERDIHPYQDDPPAYTDISTQKTLGTKNTIDGALDQQNAEDFEKSLDWIPRRDVHPSGATLERPVAIPQTYIGGRLEAPPPFVRAYSPVLYQHNILEADFAAFIDGLNIVKAPSPAFQALNVVGMGIGYVPHHWAQAASAGIGVAAGAGGAAVSYARTKRYLQIANDDYFEPRGFKISLKKDGELGSLLQLGSDIPALVPVTPGSPRVDIKHRRLRVLEPFIAPLSFNVPPPNVPTNPIDRMAAKQQAFKAEKREKKQVKKRAENLQKLQEKAQKRSKKYDSNFDSYDLGSSDPDHESIISLEGEIDELDRKVEKINARAEKKKIGESPKKVAKIDSKRMEDIGKVAKDQQKINRDLEKKVSKCNEKAAEKEAKLLKKVGRLEWIVVEQL